MRGFFAILTARSEMFTPAIALTIATFGSPSEATSSASSSSLSASMTVSFSSPSV